MSDLLQIKILFPSRRAETYEFVEKPEGMDRTRAAEFVKDRYTEVIHNFKSSMGFAPTSYDLHAMMAYQLAKADNGLTVSRSPFIAIGPENDLVLEVA
jgi:hypothetical protein